MKTDNLGRTELHYVAIDFPREKHSQEITRLVAEGYDPNQKDKNGWTALHFASQEQSLEATKVLLALGANVNATDSQGNTPLWRAVFNCRGQGEVINALLEAGADADKKNDHGISPRDLANKIANYNIAKFLK